ncbi:MAG: ABC transporter substrate-binding protein [Lachnospiraceae bacterium]|nr:ABC transporter substrate-binding protein [Lachnospiraceae bacterium]
MKKLKKITAISLILILVFALCACSKSDDTKKDDTTPTPETEVTETEKTDITATEAPEVTEDPTVEPTAEPTEEPTAEPTEEPTAEPTANPEPVATEIEVTDMIGRTVKVTPGSYKRVVCIGAGALRMYCYIGDANLLCGVEDIDNETLTERPKMFDASPRPYVLAYGDVFATLPSCGVGGPNAQAAEAEKILSCNPDIVISEYEDVEKEDALQEQLGVPVITMKAGFGGVFDEPFKGSMRLLGTIFGEEEKAEALVSFVEKEAADISARTADIPEEEKPSVYICGLGNWGTTNHLMTAQNYNVFKIANIKNVVNDLENPGMQAIEEEKFISLGANTDIMIIDAAAVKNILPLYTENPEMFDDVKAWKNGEVYLEMAYNSYYTNFELALINTWFIAKSVYPDKFSDIDITEKTKEITKQFLGKELSEEIFSKPASFGGYQKLDTAAFGTN